MYLLGIEHSPLSTLHTPEDSYNVSPMPTHIVHPSELRLSKATPRFN